MTFTDAERPVGNVTPGGEVHVRARWSWLLAVVIVAAACARPVQSPSPIASPEVTCEAATFEPTASLMCGPAITAALATLEPGHAPIVRAIFQWGGLCLPAVPCVVPSGDTGTVIIEFAGAPTVVIYVTASGSAVSASTPAPYPSGY
jgi:hypothetical protein